MTNLNVRIFGSANLSQVSGEFAKLEAQVTRLNAAMAAQVNQRGLVDPAGFKRMNAEVTRSSQVYRNALASTGMFRVEQLRVNTATDNYTKALQNQKLGLRDLIKQQKVAAAAYREQIAMQQMVVRTSRSGIANGKQVIDVSFPEHVNKQLDTFGNRLGWANEQMRSLATQTVNWGKNTQWAGRQLMTGFTIPVAAAGAGMAVLAYQADQQLSRIAKVYDVYSQDQAGKERELATLRQDSMNMGAQAAEKYGAALNDTLKVEAELAATGERGDDLRIATMETVRIATLGELDYGDAIGTTIALQNAFKMSNADLTDTFNYMNAVENATSLSIQDIAEATPRAASAMAGLNVTAKEMTVLLVAMKERGIDAAEGANALKSATTRILSPVKAASDYFGRFGINLQQMSDQSGGNLYEFLQLLAKATVQMDILDKQRGIAKLFGAYQYNRLNGALQGVTDSLFNMGDQSSQTAKAVELLSKDSAYLAETAQQELDRSAAQISTQFKKSLESLKVQLAQAGMPFLEIGNQVLKVVLSIIKAFNGMPDSAQKIAIITAILLAATGPAIMLVGLTANLIGNFMKMGVSVVGMATKFELLSKEQRAAQLAAKLAESGFVSERQALANLTAEMQKYALAQQVANRSILNRVSPTTMAAPTTIAGSMSGTFNGGWMPANVAAAQANNAASSKAAAAASQKQKDALKGAAESGGVLAAGMVVSAVSSNQTVDNIANIAMLAAIAGPALLGMAKGLMAVKWTEIGSSITSKWATGMSAVSGSANKFTTALKTAPGALGKTGMLVRGIGGGIAGLLGPVGILIGLVAAGAISWKLIHDRIVAAKKEVQQMTDNKALGGILGYTPQDAAVIDQTSKKASDVHDKVSQIRNEFGGVIDKIKQATSEQEKFNVAMQYIGLQVIDQGGTVEQAKEAVSLALQAAGDTAEKAGAVVIKFQGQFDSSGLIEQASFAAEQFTKSAMENIDKMGFWENVTGGKDQISNEAEEWGKQSGEKIAQGIRTAMDAGLGQGQTLTNIDKSLKPLGDKLAALRAEQEKIRKESGTGSVDDEKISQQIAMYEKLRAAAVRQVITNLAGKDAADKFTDSQLANMTATDQLTNSYVNVTEADRMQYLAAKNSTGQTLTLAEAQALSAYESNKNGEALRAAAAGTAAVGSAAADTKTDLDLLTAKFKDANEAYTAYAGAVQEGTKSAMNEYADQAQSNFSNRMNAAMDAYKASQDARMEALRNLQDKASKSMDARQDADNKRLETSQKAAQRRLDSIQDAQDESLEKRQDVRRLAIEKSYDSRIDKIKATMDAEQKSEDLREKIFEAEMTRISRLAESANRNIDFNSALNSGNMDEAAKIMNDSMAANTSWDLSDANDSAKDAFDKRQDALGASIDAIEKAKDARIDALKTVEDAEKKALDLSQQRQQDALNASQDREKSALQLRLQREKENLAARQKAEQDVLSKRIDQNVKAEQRIWDQRKVQLDRAITDFQNFAPKNAAELQAHINDISGKYDQFRVTTRGKFNGTAADVKTVLSRNITVAMQEVAANKQWETVGADIVAKMTKGAFNMDMNQFVKWVTTGETPKNWTASKAALTAGAKINAANQNKKNANDRRLPAYHVGGQIGVDSGGRAGIQGKMHHSEVPLVGQRGEFMVNKKQSAKHLGLLQAVNSGNYDGEGMGGGLGFAGMMAAGIAGAGAMAIGQGIQMAAARRMSQDAANTGMAGGMFSAAKAGKYGQGSFSAEQLANASIIANVGSTMNMGARDIEIAIMTAITESGLKNLRYGDRDSQGLFQQRPSQGWGTVAEITNPVYAATKFFEALKGVKNRGAMDPWMAAQSVQRSFDSSGSNYKQYWDEAMAIFGGMGQDNGGTMGVGPSGPANRTGMNAIAWAQARLGDEGWLGLCQKFVRMSLGAGGGFPSAIAAWQGAKKRHGIANPSAVPAGVPVYWGGGQFGHVALSTGGGGVIGTDFPTMGKIGRGTISGIGAKWHKPLLGWTEDINGKKIYGLPGLKTGAHTLSDGLAMLHNRETVLTAPLSEKLKTGIDDMASGGSNSYTFHIDARGTDLSEKEIAQIAIAGFEAKEARKPVSRKGTDS